MDDMLLAEIGLLWAAILCYAAASIVSATGLIFGRGKIERTGYLVVMIGVLVHGAAILYRWKTAGHGPYLDRFEVLSANAWIMIVLFLGFQRIFPRIRAVGIFVFPATFLMLALGLFSDPSTSNIPPAVRSLWLILHVTFYKIASGTILIALGLSFFTILKTRSSAAWLGRVPDVASLDLSAYRFAGFGFVFWTIGMLAGSIWAYQLWGRFWAWDPIETWSLLTWISLGLYLHLRRFFGWKGERSACFFVVCTVMSLIALFLVPIIETTVHSVYFS